MIYVAILHLPWVFLEALRVVSRYRRRSASTWYQVSAFKVLQWTQYVAVRQGERACAKIDVKGGVSFV